MSLSAAEVKSIWDQQYGKVFGYLYKRVNTREDVEDLTSLAMTTLLDSLLTGKKVENLDAFTFKIAHNHLLNFIRSKSRKPLVIPVEHDNWGEYEPAADNSFSDSYTHKLSCLQDCMQESLRDAEYTIVEKSILEGKKSPEVAELLGIKPAALRKRLSRALDKIREKCRDIWHNFNQKDKIV